VSRRAAIEAAVQIIDEKGLDELSVRALGRSLGVTGASLYHHFTDKDEILVEVVRYILRDVQVPKPGKKDPNRSWQDYIVDSTVAYREAFQRHPNAAPLLMTRPWRGFAHEVVDSSVQALKKAGVPPQLQMPIMRASEMLAFAAAIFSEYSDNDGFGEVAPEFEGLRTALENDVLSNDQSFEVTLRALVTGFSALAAMGAVPSLPGWG
jgi:AcrR family transcriptional regulator